ncbi:hypothetical protein [Leptobacterium sp. I13]
MKKIHDIKKAFLFQVVMILFIIYAISEIAYAFGKALGKVL